MISLVCDSSRLVALILREVSLMLLTTTEWALQEKYYNNLCITHMHSLKTQRANVDNRPHWSKPCKLH